MSPYKPFPKPIIFNVYNNTMKEHHEWHAVEMRRCMKHHAGRLLGGMDSREWQQQSLQTQSLGKSAEQSSFCISISINRACKVNSLNRAENRSMPQRRLDTVVPPQATDIDQSTATTGEMDSTTKQTSFLFKKICSSCGIGTSNSSRIPQE